MIRLKLLALLSLFFACSPAFSAKQYVCTFGSQVRFTNDDPKNPTSAVFVDDAKYTFKVYDNNDASYVRLKEGIILPLTMVENGKTINFIERNFGDNQFIVTVFLSDNRQATSVPAIFTLHSWNKESKADFGRSYTALGQCMQLAQ